MLLLIKASLWSCFCLLEDVAAHFTSHTALKILVFKAIHLQPCGKAFAPFLIFFFFFFLILYTRHNEMFLPDLFDFKITQIEHV